MHVQVLVDPPADLASDAAMHDLAWNALFSLVREMGSFTGTLADLMVILRQSESSSQQLRSLIR